MQSFKQFLKEDEANHNPNNYDLSSPIIRIITDITKSDAFDFEFENDGEIPAWVQMANTVDEDIQRYSGNKSVACYFGPDAEFVLSVETDNFSASHIDQVASQMIKWLQKVLEKTFHIEHSTFLCFRNKLSEDIRSDYDRIEFYLPHSKPFTLANIDKHLPAAKIISIENPEKIIGNVLGLLKIKSLQQVSWVGHGSMPKWIGIINDHLDGDRDILQCQEDLIDAGLQQYARL